MDNCYHACFSGAIQGMVKKIQKSANLVGLNYFCCFLDDLSCRARWISSFGKSYMVRSCEKYFYVVSVKALSTKH